MLCLWEWILMLYFYRSDKIHNVPETWDGIINLCRNSDFGLPIKLGLTTSDIQDMMYNIIEIKRRWA